MSTPALKKEVLKLYTHISRKVKKLKGGERDYYSYYAKNQFIQHSDEVDPERIKEIVEKGWEYSKWIENKYQI